MNDLPKTMRALVLRHSGTAGERLAVDLSDLDRYLALAECPVPQPGQGEVLVRMVRAAVNPSDAAFIKGAYGRPRQAGEPAGFEGFGRVVAGEGPIGARVNVTRAASGKWAEYVKLPADALIPLREDLRDEDAAALVVNPMTAAAMAQIVEADGAPSFVATAAGSQLGKFLVSLGREKGQPCLAVVRRQAQAEELQRLGAADVLVSTAPDFSERMRAAIDEHAPRVLLDAVGDQVAADLFFAMPDGARWINYGKLSEEAPRLTELPQLLFRDKRIEGFWLSTWFARTSQEAVARTFAEVQERFADGRWRTEVTDAIPLEDALARLPEAYARKDGKTQIVCGAG